MKILEVTYAGYYMIDIEFEDGTKGCVDLSDLVQSGVFTALKDRNAFAKVYTTGYSVAWSEQLEIDAAALYAEVTGKEPATFYAHKSYASN
ncbi:MAG TPA: DUF2442 domain-containing protein [Lacibacter sp.]|nr:DUF2442 domain-containing protein [Lacibacter sp.]HMO90009.1 DUF2442 domain-containing protein [Lacibacter sp.]HMP88295.1 DUF2442 domain-containing protein [Lacibacter sp.]